MLFRSITSKLVSYASILAIYLDVHEVIDWPPLLPGHVDVDLTGDWDLGDLDPFE